MSHDHTPPLLSADDRIAGLDEYRRVVVVDGAGRRSMPARSIAEWVQGIGDRFVVTRRTTTRTPRLHLHLVDPRGRSGRPVGPALHPSVAPVVDPGAYHAVVATDDGRVVRVRLQDGETSDLARFHPDDVEWMSLEVHPRTGQVLWTTANELRVLDPLAAVPRRFTEADIPMRSTASAEANGVRRYLEPAFAPDGRQLALVSGIGPASAIRVHSLRWDDRPDRISGRWPSWSPDGTRLAYQIDSHDGPRTMVARPGQDASRHQEWPAAAGLLLVRWVVPDRLAPPARSRVWRRQDLPEPSADGLLTVLQTGFDRDGHHGLRALLDRYGDEVAAHLDDVPTDAVSDSIARRGRGLLLDAIADIAGRDGGSRELIEVVAATRHAEVEAELRSAWSCDEAGETYAAAGHSVLARGAVQAQGARVDPHQWARTLICEGVAAFHVGDLDRADGILRDAISAAAQLDDDRASVLRDAYRHLHRLHAHREQDAEAADVADRMVDLAERTGEVGSAERWRTEAHLRREGMPNGRVLIEGDGRRIEATVDAIRQGPLPDNPRFHYETRWPSLPAAGALLERARACRQRNDHRAALRRCADALRADRHCHQAHVIGGMSEIRLALDEKAAAHLDIAEWRAPGWWHTRSLVRVARDVSRWDLDREVAVDAIAAIEHPAATDPARARALVDAAPDEPLVHHAHALALLAADQEHGAVAAWRTGIERAAGDPSIQGVMAMALVSGGHAGVDRDLFLDLADRDDGNLVAQAQARVARYAG